jgi:hypothetical protein
LQHLADQGYYVAGLSSRDALKSIKDANGRIAHHVALSSLASLFEQAKVALKLPAATPLVVTGLSRGANMAVIAAGAPDLQRSIVGGVAIALTREADYLDVPAGAEKTAGIELDAKGRRPDVPGHSADRNDSVRRDPVHQRQLRAISRIATTPRDPTRPFRRLYEVTSGGHNFNGGEDVMFRDLDDALTWITARK